MVTRQLNNLTDDNAFFELVTKTLELIIKMDGLVMEQMRPSLHLTIPGDKEDYYTHYPEGIVFTGSTGVMYNFYDPRDPSWIVKERGDAQLYAHARRPTAPSVIRKARRAPVKRTAKPPWTNGRRGNPFTPQACTGVCNQRNPDRF